MVSVVSGGGAPTIREAAQAKARSETDDVASEPIVRALFAAFPGATIGAVRSLIEPAVPAPVATAALDAPDDDVGYAADDFTDDDL